MSNVKNIAIIGAGIVGLSTSYYLQSSGHKVTIFDLDLNQSRAINLEDINSIFIKLLLSGLSSKSDEYEIQLNELNNFSIVPRDGSPEIKFIFNRKNLSLIRYTDNLGIEHGIELIKL